MASGWGSSRTTPVARIERIERRIEDDLGLPDLAFVRFDDVRIADQLPPLDTPAVERPPIELGAATSSLTPDEHAKLVACIHALLADGECYQVNLTRRLTFQGAPDPYALFTALTRLNPAPHAGVCVFGDALPGVAVVSASPELFLRVDGCEVETRPIKGTAADAATLRASAKDRAENLMIVDLAAQRSRTRLRVRLDPRAGTLRPRSTIPASRTS